jgi:hypothetical protein
MTKDKQIEELSKDIFEHCNAGLFEDEAKEIARFVIEGQGYRKAEDVAREIFEEIEKHLKNLCRTGYVGNMSGILAELKKEYTEGEG